MDIIDTHLDKREQLMKELLKQIEEKEKEDG